MARILSLAEQQSGTAGCSRSRPNSPEPAWWWMTKLTEAPGSKALSTIRIFSAALPWRRCRTELLTSTFSGMSSCAPSYSPPLRELEIVPSQFGRPSSIGSQ